MKRIGIFLNVCSKGRLSLCINALIENFYNIRNLWCQGNCGVVSHHKEAPGGAPKSVAGMDHCYPLHMAVKFAKLDVVELLIEHGAKVDAIDVQGRSILYYAVRKNAAEILGLLLKKGAKIDSEVGEQAAASLKRLLDANRELQRPSHVIPVIPRLVDVDGRSRIVPVAAKIDPVCKSETKPLFLAVGERGKIHIVKMLLDAGAEINIPKDRNESTALHEAAKWGRRNIIELLLRRGANVNALDEDGKSVLNHATFCEHNPSIDRHEYNEILQLLFSYGAPIVNRKDLLRGAISRGNVDTLRLLSRHGLKLEEVSKWPDSEKSPLLLAASNSDVNVLKYLLNTALLDVDAQDDKGSTALHVAIENKYLIHTKVLLEWHANPDLERRNRYLRETATDLAVGMGLEKSVELLLFAYTDLVANPKVFRDDLLFVGSSASRSFRATHNVSIIRHMIKYTALLDVLCDRIDPSYRYNVPKFSFTSKKNFADDWYKKCIAEIKLMQVSILQDQITFYDIFPIAGFTQCSKKIHDIDVVNDKTLEECFPIYGKQIRQRLGQITSARRLEHEAIGGLSSILRKNVEPFHLITKKILADLSREDLQALRALGALYRHYRT